MNIFLTDAKLNENKAFIKVIKTIENDNELEGVEYIDQNEDIVGVDNEKYSVPMFVESKKSGNKVLQYHGYRYRRAYQTKQGRKWICSTNKHCKAFVLLNETDEIIYSDENHIHSSVNREEILDEHQEGMFYLFSF